MVCFCLVLFLDMADMLIAKALLVNCWTIMEPLSSPAWMLHFNLKVFPAPPLFFFHPACLHVM